MAVTVVAASTAPGAISGATSYTLTPATAFGHAVPAGNLVVAWVIPFGGAITPPAGWSTSITDLGTAQVFWREFDGTEGASHVWTFPSGGYVAQAVEYASGDPGAWSVDKAVGTAGSGSGTTYPFTSTGTLSTADEAVFAAGVVSSSPMTGVASAGWSVAVPTFGGAGNIGFIGWRAVAATTALAPTFTWTGSGTRGVGGIWTFHKAVAGPSIAAAVPLVLDAPAPAVTASAAPAPSAVAETLAVGAPTVVASGSAAPAAVALGLGVPAPSVLVGTPVPVAAPVALALAVPSPQVAYDTTVSPATVGLALAAPAPSAQGGTTVTISAPVALRVQATGAGFGFYSSGVAGASGGWIQTPDAAVLEVAGNQEFVVEVDVETAAVTGSTFAARWLNDGSGATWWLGMNTLRRPWLQWRDGGGTNRSAVGTAALPAGRIALRARLTATSPATVEFDTATDLDHVTGSASWSPLGAPVVVASAVGVNTAQATALRLMAYSSGNPFPARGWLSYFHLRDGFAGQLVARWDADRAALGEQIRNGSGELGDSTGWPAGFTWQADGLRTAQSGSPTGPDLIPVDWTKPHEFSMSWRGDPGVGQRHYVAMMNADADGQRIALSQGGAITALGILAADLKPGDSSVQLVSAAGWQNAGPSHQRILALWPYTDSLGKVWTREERFTKHIKGDTAQGAWNAGAIVGNTITLAAPWNIPNPAHPLGWWPAGTEVANTFDSSTYQYVLASNEVVGDSVTWVQRAVTVGPAPTVSSLPPPSSLPVDVLRPGTRYFATQWLTNRDVPGGAVVYTDASWRDLAPTGAYVDTVNELRWSVQPSEGSFYSQSVGAPTVTATATAPPATAALALGIPAPTIVSDTRVTPTATALALAVPAPTIRTDASPAPSATALTLAAPAPTIVSDTRVTPTAVALTLATPAATVASDTRVTTVAPVALTITVPTPTKIVTAPLQPVALTLAIPPPTVIIDQDVPVAAPVPLTLAVPAVTIQTRDAYVTATPDLMAASGPSDRFPLPPYDPTRTVAAGYTSGTPYRPGAVNT